MFVFSQEKTDEEHQVTGQQAERGPGVTSAVWSTVSLQPADASEQRPTAASAITVNALEAILLAARSPEADVGSRPDAPVVVTQAAGSEPSTATPVQTSSGNVPPFPSSVGGSTTQGHREHSTPAPIRIGFAIPGAGVAANPAPTTLENITHAPTVSGTTISGCDVAGTILSRPTTLGSITLGPATLETVTSGPTTPDPASTRTLTSGRATPGPTAPRILTLPRPSPAPATPGPSRPHTPIPAVFSGASSTKASEFADTNPYSFLAPLDSEDEEPSSPPSGASFASMAAKLQGSELNVFRKVAVDTGAGNTNKLPALSKLSSMRVKNEQNLHFSSVAYYSVGGKEQLSLLLKDSMTLSSFSKREDDTFCLTSQSECETRCMAVSPSGRHVVLTPDGDSLEIYDWPYNVGLCWYTALTKTGSAFRVSATESFFMYSFSKSNEVIIACMTLTDNNRSRLEWVQSTGMQHHRALNAIERDGEIQCVLLSRHLNFQKQPKEMETPALTALNSAGTLWSISFKNLDRNAKLFDLFCIDNDGQNFFVANAREKCVYVVSLSGQILGRILEHCNQAFNIAINKQALKLCLYNGFTNIVFYKIKYHKNR